MAEHVEANNGTHGPRFESRIARDGAIPDATFAEPWFGRDRAGFGLLAGRNKIVEVSVGPGGRELRIGRFTGTRRRNTTPAGVAKVLGLSVTDTEHLLARAEKALRAGIAAYRETFWASAAEPFRPSGALASTREAAAERVAGAAVGSAAAARPAGHQWPGDAGARQRRAPAPGADRTVAPVMPPRDGRDQPDRPRGLSL